MKLSADAGHIIARGRDALEPTSTQRSRVRSGIDARLVVGTGLAVAGSVAITESTAVAARGVASAGIWGKTIAISALVVVTSAGAVAYHRTARRELNPLMSPATLAPQRGLAEPTRPRVQLRSVAPKPVVTASTVVAPTPTPVQAHGARKQPRGLAAHSRNAGTSLHTLASRPTSRLGREAALLRRAREAVDTARYARARMWLDAYARVFPKGQLAREASKLRRLLTNAEAAVDGTD